MSIGLKVHLVIPTQAEINNLFKNLKTELPLQLDTQAIATMKTQLEQITKMEFKLANMGQFLSDLQAMTTELENQVALAKQLSETYGSNSGELTKAILELKRELLQVEKVTSKYEADIEKVRVKQELVNQGALDKVRLEHELATEKEKAMALSKQETTNLGEQEASLKRLNTLLEKNVAFKEKIINSSKKPTQSINALSRNEAEISSVTGTITDPTLLKEAGKLLSSNEKSTQASSKMLYRDLSKTTTELTNTMIKLNNLEKEGNEEQAKSLREQIQLLTQKQERLKAIVSVPAFNNSNSDYEYQSLVDENSRKLMTQQGQFRDQAKDIAQYKAQEETLKHLLELQQKYYGLRSKIATVKSVDEVQTLQEEMKATQNLINQTKKLVTHKELVAKATSQQAELDRKTGAIVTEVYSHLTKLSNEYEANQRQIKKLSADPEAHQLQLQTLVAINTQLDQEIEAYKEIVKMSDFNNFGKDVKFDRNDEVNLRKNLELEVQISDQKDQQRAKALELIELKKRELTQSIKVLESGRNAEYVDVDRLNKLKTAITQLNGTSTKQVQSQVRLLKQELKELSSDANIARINKTGGSLGTLGLSLKSVLGYFTGTTLIRQFFNELRSGASDVQLLNDAFTTLSMTMTKFSSQNINDLLDQTKALSNELSGDLSSVLNTVMEIANDSESVETIINKTRPSVILSNIGGVSETDAVSMIQGAMRQFSEFADQTEEDAMKVANSMTSISRSLALGFQDGLQGMSSTVSNVGSMASFLGMTFDETMSMVSGTVEKTRLSFDEVSVALRAIMARTMRITDDSVDASEETFLKVMLPRIFSNEYRTRT